jgi:hypothetical protein
MDIADLILGIVALACTVVMAVIPLRHDIYDKPAKRYTKPGRWFIGAAAVALASGITLQARTYLESVKTASENSQERKSLHHQLDSVSHHLDSLSNLRQRHLDDGSKARLIQRVNDSLAAHQLPKTSLISIGRTMGNEEALNFAIEVATFLSSQGFNISRNIGPTLGNEGRGFWVTLSDGHIFIDVGISSFNGYP